MNRPIDRILNLLYPRHCPGCAEILKDQDLLLCPSCRKSLSPITEDYCLIAAAPLHQDGICFYQPRIGSNKVYALIAGMLDHLTHWHIPHEHVGNGAILPVSLKPVRGIALLVIVNEQDADATILQQAKNGVGKIGRYRCLAHATLKVYKTYGSHFRMFAEAFSFVQCCFW